MSDNINVTNGSSVIRFLRKHGASAEPSYKDALDILNKMYHIVGQPVMITYRESDEVVKVITALGIINGTGRDCYTILSNGDIEPVLFVTDSETPDVSQVADELVAVCYGPNKVPCYCTLQKATSPEEDSVRVFTPIVGDKTFYSGDDGFLWFVSGGIIKRSDSFMSGEEVKEYIEERLRELEGNDKLITWKAPGGTEDYKKVLEISPDASLIMSVSAVLDETGETINDFILYSTTESSTNYTLKSDLFYYNNGGMYVPNISGTYKFKVISYTGTNIIWTEENDRNYSSEVTKFSKISIPEKEFISRDESIVVTNTDSKVYLETDQRANTCISISRNDLGVWRKVVDGIADSGIGLYLSLDGIGSGLAEIGKGTTKKNTISLHCSSFYTSWCLSNLFKFSIQGGSLYVKRISAGETDVYELYLKVLSSTKENWNYGDLSSGPSNLSPLSCVTNITNTLSENSTDLITSGAVWSAVQELKALDKGITKIKIGDTDFTGESVDLSDTVEVTGNKITTISSSSTDLEYPSAKAVYNLTKTIRDQVVANTTEIASLKNSLKGVVIGENTVTAQSGDQPYAIITPYVEEKSNKIQEITSTSTSIEYPSAKAVKDYVDSAINGENGNSVVKKSITVTDSYINGSSEWQPVLKVSTPSKVDVKYGTTTDTIYIVSDGIARVHNNSEVFTTYVLNGSTYICIKKKSAPDAAETVYTFTETGIGSISKSNLGTWLSSQETIGSSYVGVGISKSKTITTSTDITDFDFHSYDKIIYTGVSKTLNILNLSNYSLKGVSSDYTIVNSTSHLIENLVIKGKSENGELAIFNNTSSIEPGEEIVVVYIPDTNTFAVKSSEKSNNIKYEIVNSFGDLPLVGEVGTIYFVPNNLDSDNNRYTEYIYLEGVYYETLGGSVQASEKEVTIEIPGVPFDNDYLSVTSVENSTPTFYNNQFFEKVNINLKKPVNYYLFFGSYGIDINSVNGGENGKRLTINAHFIPSFEAYSRVEDVITPRDPDEEGNAKKETQYTYKESRKLYPTCRYVADFIYWHYNWWGRGYGDTRAIDEVTYNSRYPVTSYAVKRELEKYLEASYILGEDGIIAIKEYSTSDGKWDGEGQRPNYRVRLSLDPAAGSYQRVFKRYALFTDEQYNITYINKIVCENSGESIVAMNEYDVNRAMVSDPNEMEWDITDPTKDHYICLIGSKTTSSITALELTFEDKENDEIRIFNSVFSLDPAPNITATGITTIPYELRYFGYSTTTGTPVEVFMKIPAGTIGLFRSKATRINFKAGSEVYAGNFGVEGEYHYYANKINNTDSAGTGTTYRLNALESIPSSKVEILESNDWTLSNKLTVPFGSYTVDLVCDFEKTLSVGDYVSNDMVNDILLHKLKSEVRELSGSGKKVYTVTTNTDVNLTNETTAEYRVVENVSLYLEERESVLKEFQVFNYSGSTISIVGNGGYWSLENRMYANFYIRGGIWCSNIQFNENT